MSKQKTKKVEVRYFAMMREQAGIDQEFIEGDFLNAADLYLFLQKIHDFKIERKNLKVAINESYQSFDHVLINGDVVVFIPPVAGG